MAGRPGAKTGGAELLAVAERLVRGLAATAEAGLQGQELLSFAIVNPHEAAQFQRSVFDAGDGQGLRPIDLHTIGGLLKRPGVEKFNIEMPPIADWFHVRRSATAEGQVVGMGARTILLYQGQITRNAQRAAGADLHLIGNIQLFGQFAIAALLEKPAIVSPFAGGYLRFECLWGA